MDDFKIALMTSIITSLVTIIGFVISWRNIKFEMKLLQENQKRQERNKVSYRIPKDIMDYVKLVMCLCAEKKINDDKFEKLASRIFNTVICYGTEDAVKVQTYIKHLVYYGRDGEIPFEKAEYIAAHIVLLMQIKYDLTGIKTSPKVWYVQFSTNYMQSLGNNFYMRSIESVNKIVDALGLDDFLKIDSFDIFE